MQNFHYIFLGRSSSSSNSSVIFISMVFIEDLSCGSNYVSHLLWILLSMSDRHVCFISMVSSCAKLQIHARVTHHSPFLSRFFDFLVWVVCLSLSLVRFYHAPLLCSLFARSALRSSVKSVFLVWTHGLIMGNFISLMECFVLFRTFWSVGGVPITLLTHRLWMHNWIDWLDDSLPLMIDFPIVFIFFIDGDVCVVSCCVGDVESPVECVVSVADPVFFSISNFCCYFAFRSCYLFPSFILTSSHLSLGSAASSSCFPVLLSLWCCCSTHPEAKEKE